MEIISARRVGYAREKIRKNKKLFVTYEEMVLGEPGSTFEASSQRKALLSTYLYLFGLNKMVEIAKELGYLDYAKYSMDLLEITEESMGDSAKISKKAKRDQVETLIIKEIVNDFLVNEISKSKIEKIITVEGVETTFISMALLSPHIIDKMQTYGFCVDIQDLIEKILVHYKKLESFEFIKRVDIEKYEIYYELEGEELRDVLYIMR